MKLFNEMISWFGENYSISITSTILMFIMSFTNINDILKTTGLLVALIVGIFTAIAKVQEVMLNKMRIKEQIQKQKTRNNEDESEMD